MQITPEEFEKIKEAARDFIGETRRQFGRINIYDCKFCGHSIFTFDRDDGVTPCMLACRNYQIGCRGDMLSRLYKVPQLFQPTHVWYRPCLEEIARKFNNAASIEHIKRGGLVLREYQPKIDRDVWHEYLKSQIEKIND